MTAERLREYSELLKRKAPAALDRGYSGPVNLNPSLKPHARDCAAWGIRGGNRAFFLSYSLHKTSIQLQVCESLISAYLSGSITGAPLDASALIVCPLGVRREFILESDARGFEEKPINIRDNVEHEEAFRAGYRIFLANYDRVRDGQVDPKRFQIATLDEASVLRGYGTKTYQEFLPLFAGVPFKFVATATPSPNRLKELIHYAGFLGIMDTGSIWFYRTFLRCTARNSKTRKSSSLRRRARNFPNTPCPSGRSGRSTTGWMTMEPRPETTFTSRARAPTCFVGAWESSAKHRKPPGATFQW